MPEVATPPRPLLTWFASLAALAPSTALAALDADDSELLRSELRPAAVLLAGDDHDGWRLRGDWEPPDTLLLTWSEAFSASQAAILRRAVREVDVHVLVPGRESLTVVRRWLSSVGVSRRDVTLVGAPLDTPWIRDYGPLATTAPDGRMEWIDPWYDETRPEDDLLPATLGARFSVPVRRLPLVFEGGAIISNGRGLCATTHERLLEEELDLNDPDLVQWLLAELRCLALVLVPALRNDESHHVDLLAQFLRPDRVGVASVNPAEAPEDVLRLAEATRGLLLGARMLGQRLDVVRVPVTVSGRIYRTYLNSTRLPRSLLVPSYSAASEEEEAYQALHWALPDVELVPIPSDDTMALGGAVHCLTLGLSLNRSVRRADPFAPLDPGRTWQIGAGRSATRGYSPRAPEVALAAAYPQWTDLRRRGRRRRVAGESARAGSQG